MNCHVTILLAQLVQSESWSMLVFPREPKGVALELNLGEARDSFQPFECLISSNVLIFLLHAKLS